MPDLDVVTGAFGYTGRYITGRLLESGRDVKTLTGHPNRPNPFGDRIDVFVDARTDPVPGPHGGGENTSNNPMGVLENCALTVFVIPAAGPPTP